MKRKPTFVTYPRPSRRTLTLPLLQLSVFSTWEMSGGPSLTREAFARMEQETSALRFILLLLEIRTDGPNASLRERYQQVRSVLL